jgi:hypothetical protein
MTKVMESDFRQSEPFQLPLEVLEDVSRVEGRPFIR